MQRLLLLCLPLTLGAAAPQQAYDPNTTDAQTEAKLARALQGFTKAGPPQSCIPTLRGDISSTTIGRTILYRVNRNQIYANETNGCERAERGDALIVVNPVASQLCSGQIMQTVDVYNRFVTGGCALGQFTPYRRDR
ncbi:hypothetical protein [Sphingomonas sp.]|uniref:hypothetical protein n=1 Tax=Sphingomonas sp. TaxID=28214 RepID=UPI001D9F1556|nr:hypothetical protein [Sphingomonas sp.]MBX9797229.1 hypothetical protein [Sphingomonas sp.]